MATLVVSHSSPVLETCKNKITVVVEEKNTVEGKGYVYT